MRDSRAGRRTSRSFVRRPDRARTRARLRERLLARRIRRNQDRRTRGRCSSARIDASFFHQSCRGFSTLTTASVIESLRRSMPAVVIWPTTTSPKRSSVRPGQRIRFAEHEPVVRLGVELLAQRERDVEAVYDQRLVERMRDAAHDEPRRDQRMRIHVADTDGLARVIEDRGDLAGLELRERRARDIDFVREHPQMSFAKALVLCALEKQRRYSMGSLNGRSDSTRTRTVTARRARDKRSRA